MHDFFISYTGNDRPWAEWIAWVLEEAGYSVIIQAWDFQVGGNFVLDMQKATEAKRTIAVLSALYLTKPFPQSEWAAAFAQDSTSANRKLIPVRVEDCNPTGLLGQIVYIDTFNCEESEAQQRLLAAVKDGRMKPTQRPGFPGQPVQREVSEHVSFPGQSTPATATTPLSQTAAQPPQSPAVSLTVSQKHRLQQKLDTLQPELDLRTEKLKQLRKGLAIMVDPATKFKLQNQIQDEEALLAKLEDEIETIEATLRST
ncbi:MAG: toll/interleukin-1 receptor domain-containing protein [Scytolyngbya sp. HA4215-MV1]|nr:toll/interleukin-1 receptor domain-containing protein [Scytolyngbya sp. HA4215-MV1]